jgi:ubiquinone/menaquinone biosynthesis C-methylase UbiE
VGSAIDLPLPDASFDLALLLHVGMNVQDKPGLFREARRVLRDGGAFAAYEVMRTGDGDLAFPVPWAETPQSYRAAARATGFGLEAEENRGRSRSISFRGFRRRPRAERLRHWDCTT